MAKARVKSLDGLRGIAALIVMIGHVALASSMSGVPSANGPWLLTRTPLQVLFAGHEMVVIFFVLSGYVLALPAAKKGARWFDRSYYPRRLVRLYLPVWAALIFAGLMHVLFERHVNSTTTEWLRLQAGPVSVAQGLQDGTLLHQPGAAEQFTGVLWSLKYEVLFSLALPLVIAWTLRIRRSPPLGALTGVLCLMIIGLGSASGAQMSEYMPMFVLGSLLAFNVDRIPVRFTGLVALVAVVLLSIGNWAEYSALAEIKTAVAACLVVWLALVAPSFGNVLRSRAAQWLGSRSYSLYLVHLPIVTAIGFALGGHANLIILWVIAAPVALGMTDVFWRLVERPAIRLARSFGDDRRVLAADGVPLRAERQHEPTGVVVGPAAAEGG